MVTGFERVTRELSDFEKEIILPIFISSWKKRKVGEENRLTMKQMITATKNWLDKHHPSKNYSRKISGPRLRKVIHYIRVEGLVPNLVANSKGYFKTDDPEQIKKYIYSLRERKNSFSELELAFENQYLKLCKS